MKLTAESSRTRIQGFRDSMAWGRVWAYRANRRKGVRRAWVSFPRHDRLHPAPASRDSPGVGSSAALRSRSLINPRLAIDLIRTGWAFRRRHWWRVAPFLPVPDPRLPRAGGCSRPTGTRTRFRRSTTSSPSRAGGARRCGCDRAPPRRDRGRRVCGAAGRQGSGPAARSRHGHRPQQPPRLPAAPLPGRERGRRSGRDRAPDPLRASPTAQHLRRPRRRDVDRSPARGASVSPTAASFTWDYLVLAPGARHSYFKHPEWEIARPGPQVAGGCLRDPHPRAPGLRASGTGRDGRRNAIATSPSWSSGAGPPASRWPVRSRRSRASPSSATSATSIRGTPTSCCSKAGRASCRPIPSR